MDTNRASKLKKSTTADSFNMKKTANKPPMPSPKFQKVIQDCRVELRNAERENIESNLQKVEQHLFNAKKILQNVLPPTDPYEK